MLFYIAVVEDKPPTAPSLTQVLDKKAIMSLNDFMKSLINLFKNKNFVLIFISYGKVRLNFEKKNEYNFILSIFKA